MNNEPKLKDKIAAKFHGSVLINAFRVAAAWLYTSIAESFIGTLFTSYSREEALWHRSLMGFGTRHKRGRNTIYKKIRRKVARGFENSMILDRAGAVADYMLGCSLRMYGSFSLIFGIYTMLMFIIKVFGIGLECDFNQMIIGGVLVILSVPVLSSKKNLAESIAASRFARYLFIETLKIPESKFTQIKIRGGAKYNAAVISGMFVGLLTYIISPVYILAGLAALIVSFIVLYQPEAGIIALIVVTPFIAAFRHPTLLLSAGVLITAISYLIKYLRGKRTMRFGLISAFVALFAGNMLLGGIVTYGGSESLNSALMYSILMLGYFLTINLIRTRENCLHTMAALGISLAVSSLYGIIQYMFGNFTSNWLDNEMFSYIPGRATSFFDNPNVLGEYIILLFPFLLVIPMYMKGFKKRFIMVFSVALTVLCLVWTWSRGAWLGFIIGIILFFLIYSRRTLAFLLAAGISLPLVGYLLPSDIAGRFASIGNMADSSTYYRVFTWRGVLRMLKEVWLSGIGVGQTAFQQLYPIFAYAGTEAAPHSHNLIMQIISETGIFGFVIFSIVIFLFFQNGFEFIRNSTGKDRLTVAAGVTGIVSILVMGLFDYVWYNYRVFFLFWIVIALMVSFINSVKNENESVYDKIKPDSVDITI